VLVARQTGALTRGRRCKPVCGLSKGPLSCYCLWFECIVGRGGRVLQCRPIAPGGKPCPKSLMGSCAVEDAARPVGPRAGRGGEEAGLHVHAELRWGRGVAWGRPRAPARTPTSLTRSSCHGGESTCIGKSVRDNNNGNSTCVARARVCSSGQHYYCTCI
jgi:hypothetical protein